MEKIKKTSLIAFFIVGIFILGVIIGRYSSKNGYKSVEIVKENIKNNVVIVTKEIKKLDGTTEKTSLIVDKSEIMRESLKEESSAQHDWSLIITRTFYKNEYSIGIERRILGPIFIGGFANTSGDCSLSLGVEF